MTYQDKLAIIDDGRAKLESGTSWSDFQSQLIAFPDLYQKDIDSIGIKVFSAVDNVHGPGVLAELEQEGTASPIKGMHESVFNKILDRQMKLAKAKIRRNIQQQIKSGGEASAVLDQNAHPLLDEDLIQEVHDTIQAEEDWKQERSVGSGTLALGIFLLIMGLGLSFVADSGRLYYGAILVGGSLVVRFIVSLSD